MKPAHQQASSRRLRLYLTIYSFVVLGVVVAGVLSTATPGFPLGGPEDFPAFYTAGTILRQGEGHRLYDIEYQSQVQRAILEKYGLVARGGLNPFPYAPFFAAFFVPLSLLSLSQAYPAWNAISIVMLVASVFVILREHDNADVRQMLLALPLSLSFLFVVAAIWRGQSSLLLLFILTMVYVALRRQQDVFAGIVLAFGLAKPQSILPLILVLVLRGRWRAVLALAITAFFLLLAWWLLVGDGLRAYPNALRVASGENMPTVLPELMPNIRGTLFRLQGLIDGGAMGPFSEQGWQALQIGLSAVLLATLPVLWRGSWNPSSREFDLRFATTLGLTLLIAPHLHSHDLSLLVLAGALLAFELAATDRASTGCVALFAGHALPLVAFLTLAPVIQAQFNALLLTAFVLVLMRELRTSGRASTA